MTAFSHRDQLATLAQLWGWTREAYLVGDVEPADVDRYRKGDMLVTVSFTPTGRIRGGDRMRDDWAPADCQIVEPRGKLGMISAWLRFDPVPRQVIEQLAAEQGWTIDDNTSADLALVRGQLDTRENAPSAAEQDGTEAVVVVFAVDGQVLYASAKGIATWADDQAAALAAILDRLTWAPPSVRCLDCRTPEHRHHLGELGQRHPFRAAMPASTQLVERASGMHDPESPDFDPDVRDQDAEREAAATPVWSDDRSRVVEVYRDGVCIWREPAADQLAREVEQDAADDGGPLDLMVSADQAAGAIATLVGVSRPDHRRTAESEGAALTKLVRRLRREVRAERARANSYRSQLGDVAGDRDAAHQRLAEQGQQLAQLRRTVVELRAAAREATSSRAAERAADRLAPQVVGRQLDVDPALLSGDVSARTLVEVMAQGDYVELSPAEHGQPGDQLVRIGFGERGRRIAGYLVGDQLLPTRLGDGGAHVPPAGVVPYLAQVARSASVPTAGTRLRLAEGVALRVSAAQRASR